MKVLQPASVFPRRGLYLLAPRSAHRFRKLHRRLLDAGQPVFVRRHSDTESTCGLFCATISNHCFCTPHPTSPTPTVQRCQPTALRGAEVCCGHLHSTNNVQSTLHPCIERASAREPTSPAAKSTSASISHSSSTSPFFSSCQRHHAP
jgi:hypothetical protein